jgi:hypothetical protein
MNIKTAKIKSIRRLPPVDKVYDLVCSEPHSYVTNGFVSHNCIAFFDEVEKMWAGVGGPSMDSGTTQNMVATFLSWAQERKSPVFILAAANSVVNLPAPMIRAGRFDRIYFVPLPDRSTREEIVRIHLRKRGWDPDSLAIDYSSIARATDQFSGAEIEQVVVEAIKIKALRSMEKDDPIVLSDFERALPRITPIFRSDPENYKEIEAWAERSGAINASSESLGRSVSLAPPEPQSLGGFIQPDEIEGISDETF